MGESAGVESYSTAPHPLSGDSARWRRWALGAWAVFAAAAKRAHAALDPAIWPSGLAFWPAGWRFVRDTYAGGAIWLFVALAALGVAVAWRRGGPAVRGLLVLAALLALVYPLLGVPFFTWYALPQLAAATVAASYGAGALIRRAVEIRSGLRWPLLAVALLVALPGRPRTSRARPPA